MSVDGTVILDACLHRKTNPLTTLFPDLSQSQKRLPTRRLMHSNPLIEKVLSKDQKLSASCLLLGEQSKRQLEFLRDLIEEVDQFSQTASITTIRIKPQSVFVDMVVL